MGLSDEQTLEIEEAMNAEIDGEAELFKGLGESDAPDTAKSAVVAAVRLLKKYGGDGLQDLVAKAGLGHEAPKTKITKAPDPPKADPVAKAQDPPELDVVLKAAQEKHDAELSKRDVQIAELEKTVGAMQDAKDDAEVTKLIEDGNLPGMSTEDQFNLVKSMTAEQRASFSALAKGLSAHVSLGDEVGTPRRGTPVASAYAEAQARAAGMIEKAKETLTEIDALEAVFRSDKDLHRRYITEQRGGAI